jgi:hypothetical protein
MRRSEPMFPPDAKVVVLYSGGIRQTVRLAEVAKVTATQVIVRSPSLAGFADRRFDIFTGYERGASVGAAMRIVPATVEARDRARYSVARDDLRSLVFKLDRFLDSEDFLAKNRSADELELSLASLKAAYEVLTA